jgi:hypothetical protein
MYNYLGINTISKVRDKSILRRIQTIISQIKLNIIIQETTLNKFQWAVYLN